MMTESKESKKTPALTIWKWIITFVSAMGILYLGFTIGRLNKGGNTIEIANGFALENFASDDIISLASFEGKGIVLNFWAPWCLPCKEEMPLLESASQAYANSGVVFIGVNTGDDLENAMAFIDIHEVTYVNGYDSTHQIEKDYQVIGIPTTWFIKANGEVAYKFMGPLDEYTLNQAISRIIVD